MNDLLADALAATGVVLNELLQRILGVQTKCIVGRKSAKSYMKNVVSAFAHSIATAEGGAPSGRRRGAAATKGLTPLSRLAPTAPL